MSEPPSISRRASAWWPAVVGLEQVMDAATALALAVSRAGPAPSAEAVRTLSSVLRAATTAAASGTPQPAAWSLPSDETLEPVTQTVRALLGGLRSGERLTVANPAPGSTRRSPSHSRTSTRFANRDGVNRGQAALASTLSQRRADSSGIRNDRPMRTDSR
jgi:hypothetical protein